MKIIAVVISLLLIIGNTKCSNDTTVVEISGKHLTVNGQDYFIKGVCYHPVKKGQTKRSFYMLDQDLSLMQEAGINTVRVYSPIDNITVLDKFFEAGIKVIIGIGYNQEGEYDILSGSFINYVKKYSTHPSILMWELGNEYNYHPEWFEGDIKNWYNALSEAARLIQRIDSNHPVSTAHGEIPDSTALVQIKHIDIWGLNIYRWDQPETAIKDWKIKSSMPFYYSEVGADSYMKITQGEFLEGENQKAQANANGKIVEVIMENQQEVAGMTIFSFVDGWWKAGNPNQQDIGGWAPNSSGVPYDGTPNEEYWGIVDINRNKKRTFDIIKQKFNSKNTSQRDSFNKQN